MALDLFKRMPCVTDVCVTAGPDGVYVVQLFQAEKDDSAAVESPGSETKRVSEAPASSSKRLAERSHFAREIPKLVDPLYSYVRRMLGRVPYCGLKEIERACDPQPVSEVVALHIKPEFVKRLLHHPRFRDLADMIINELPASVRKFPDWPPDSFTRRAYDAMPDFPRPISFLSREPWMREKDDGQVICVGRRYHSVGGFIYQFIWYACWGVPAAGSQRPVERGHWNGGSGFMSFYEGDYAFVEIPDVNVWRYYQCEPATAFHFVDGYLGDLEFAILSVKHDFIVSTGRGFYHDMLHHVRIRGSPTRFGTVDDLKLAIEAYSLLQYGSSYADGIVEFALGLHADTCTKFDPERFVSVYQYHYPATPFERVHEYQSALRAFGRELKEIAPELQLKRSAYQYIADYVLDQLDALPLGSTAAVVCTDRLALDRLEIVLRSPFSKRSATRTGFKFLEHNGRSVQLVLSDSAVSLEKRHSLYLWIDPSFDEVEYKGAGWQLRQCRLKTCKAGEVPEIVAMPTFTRNYRLRHPVRIGIGSQMQTLVV